MFYMYIMTVLKGTMSYMNTYKPDNKLINFVNNFALISWVGKYLFQGLGISVKHSKIACAMM